MATDYNTFQYDATNYIYDNWEPNQNNLFALEYFKDVIGFASGEASLDTTDYAEVLKYRIQKVRVDGISVSVDDAALNSKPFPFISISDVSRETKVTITWLDDVTHSIYNFHKAWLQNWYIRESNTLIDCFPVGIDGKYKEMELSMFRYIDNSANPAPDVSTEKVCTIKLRNMMPVDIGSPFDLDYSNGGNESIYEVTYKITSLSVNYDVKNLTSDANLLGTLLGGTIA